MINHIMKTTIDIDEAKLLRIMKLGGFKTRREAVDYSLTEAERITHLKKIKLNPLPKSVIEAGIIAEYDPVKLRALELPEKS